MRFRLGLVILSQALLLTVPSSGQSPPPKRELHGRVVQVHGNEKIPVTGTTVILEATENSDTTNSEGFFRLPLPTFYQPGETVTFVVRKEGWQIRHPLLSKVRIPLEPHKETIEIEILPAGSKAFLSHDQLEAFIANEIQKALDRQNAKPPKFDPERLIKDWATTYGLSVRQAKEQADLWFAQVESAPPEDHRKGMLAYLNGDYEAATWHFDQAATERLLQIQELQVEQGRIETRHRMLRHNAALNFRLKASSLFNLDRFHEALDTCDSGLDLVSSQDDPQQWAALMTTRGNIYWATGVRAEGELAAELLQKAVDTLERVLEVQTLERNPSEWATVQNSLGTVLWSKGRQTAGEKSSQSFSEAFERFQLALRVHRQDSMPEEWARIQDNLGNLLQDLGIRSAGPDSIRHLSEAVAAHELALTTRSRDEFPREWARTQSHLASALQNLGARSAGNKGLELLSEAVRRNRLSLLERTRQRNPQEWAMSQNNLGNSILVLALRSEPTEALEYLDQAIEAYDAGLEVRTRTELPQDWAMTMNNLAIAHKQKGLLSDPGEGLTSLASAATILREILKVRTRESLPSAWADTQNNLGAVLLEQAQQSMNDTDALDLLEEAIGAFRAILEVWSRDHQAQKWARTKSNLGVALRELAMRSQGETRTLHLKESTESFRLAMQVLTREDLPTYWAVVYSQLGITLEALGHYQEAADVFAELLAENPDLQEIAMRLSTIYHDKLFDFGSALDLVRGWLERYPNDLQASQYLMERLFTNQLFSDCFTHGESLEDSGGFESIDAAVTALKVSAAVADGQFEEACQDLGSITENLSSSPDSWTTAWTLEGVLHFIEAESSMSHQEEVRSLLESLVVRDLEAKTLRLNRLHARICALREPESL